MSKQTDLINVPDAITVSGSNVGIGTSPSAKLEVAGSSNSTYLIVGGDDSANGRGLTFTSSAGANFNGSVHTINAPSSQGVIALSTTSTERMRIDASGNVGIGTSSPTQKLSVEVEDWGGIDIKQTTTNKDPILSLIGPDAHYWNMQLDSSGSNSLEWRYDNTARMNIDTSGRVTTPNQPYFSATCSGNSAYTTFGVGVTLPFNSTARNIGSHFNTSNYRFTAPVAGNYAFSAGVITNSANPVGRPMFFVNGNQDYNNIKFGISGSNTAGAGSTNTSAILHLNANDYVDVRSQSGSMIAYTGGGHSSFTGTLIG
jgi:hypothetical protein